MQRFNKQAIMHNFTAILSDSGQAVTGAGTLVHSFINDKSRWRYPDLRGLPIPPFDYRLTQEGRRRIYAGEDIPYPIEPIVDRHPGGELAGNICIDGENDLFFIHNS